MKKGWPIYPVTDYEIILSPADLYEIPGQSNEQFDVCEYAVQVLFYHTAWAKQGGKLKNQNLPGLKAGHQCLLWILQH